MSDNKKEVKSAILEELEPGVKGRSLKELDTLSDLTLPVRVEFSRITKTIEEALSISEGDVVKLERFAGEHVDVFVDEQLFAKGEITVVDDRFGIRIVEIIPPDNKI